MRQILKKLHLVLGLGAGVVLLVMSVTGMLLAFEPQVRAWWGEDLGGGTAGERLGPGAIERALAGKLPTGEPVWYLWREDAAAPLWLRWRKAGGVERDYMVNPYTGVVMERAGEVHRFFDGVLDIHRRLGAGVTWRLIVGSATVLMIPLLLSGVLISARRVRAMLRAGFIRRVEVTAVHPWPRWRSWHRVIGAWALPLLLVAALTGLVWSFEWYRELIRVVTLSPSAQVNASVDANVPTANNQRLDLDGIWATALPYMDGSAARRIIFSSGMNGPVRIEWSPPEAPYESFRSRLWIDPHTGAVTGYHPVSAYTRAETVQRWAYPLHTGRIGGPILQAVVFLAAAAVPFLFFSGLYLYAARMRQNKRVIS